MLKLLVSTVLFVGGVYALGYEMAAHLQVFSLLAPLPDPVDSQSLGIDLGNGVPIVPDNQLQPALNTQ